MVQNSILDVLKKIANTIDDAKLDWVVCGTLGLFLQGVNIDVNNINILTNKIGLEKFSEIYLKNIKEPIHYKEGEFVKSYQLELEVGDCKINVVSETHHKIGICCGWSENQRIEDKIVLNIDGINIPVMDLEREFDFYSAVGDEEKAMKIRRHLENAFVANRMF